MSEIEQLYKIVLKDGRIIPLTLAQAERVQMLLARTPLVPMSKRLTPPGGGASFMLSDIVTDPEEIVKVTQVELSLDIMPPPRRKSMDMG